MPSNFDYYLIEMIENAKSFGKLSPLYLGNPPGGYIGQLPQEQVRYDPLESGVLTGSGSLLDNLNHIRYRLGYLEASGVLTVQEDDVTVASGVVILNFEGPLTVTDNGGGKVTVLVTASGGSGTPGGSNTQVQFNDSGAFGGDTGFTFHKTENVVVVGPFTPASLGTNGINIISESSPFVTMWSYGAAYTPFIAGIASEGTESSPTAVSDQKALLKVRGRGYDGSTYSNTQAEHRFVAVGDWNGSNHGAKQEWWVTPSGSTTMALRGFVYGSGIATEAYFMKFNEEYISYTFSNATSKVTPTDGDKFGFWAEDTQNIRQIPYLYLKRQVNNLTENSITGTATLDSDDIGLIHVCSGTSSDYTVTLPAVSGNAGRSIHFRMSSALTVRVTLDGNGSETIDGATTRVMWANETCTLYCDGSAWTKTAGKSIAMTASQRASTSQTGIVTATTTKVTLGTSVSDPTGLMNDTGNSRIYIRRASDYRVYGIMAYASLSSAGNNIQARIHYNGDTTNSLTAFSNAAISSEVPFRAVELPLYTFAKDVYVDMYTYQSTGSNQSTLDNASFHTTLYVVEHPDW